MNKPLRIAQPSDFVPVIPKLLGYLPKNSLAIVPISGSSSGSIMRIDCPADIVTGEPNCLTESDLASDVEHSIRAYVDNVVDHVSMLRDCTAAAVCLFTDVEPRCVQCADTAYCPTDPRCLECLPGEHLIDCIEDKFLQIGVQLVSALVVTNNQWYDIWGIERGPASDAVRDLTCPQISFVDRARIPSADRSAIEAIARLCGERHADGAFTSDEVLCAWNLLVDGVNYVAAGHEPTLISLVVLGLQDPKTMECILTNAVYGQESADEIARVWDTLAEEFPSQDLQGMIAARTEFDPIDHDRAERSAVVLRRVIAHTAGENQGYGLAALAWLEWSRASGSLAHHYACEALRIGDFALATQVNEYVCAGAIPGWVDGSSCLGAICDDDVDRVLQS